MIMQKVLFFLNTTDKSKQILDHQLQDIYKQFDELETRHVTGMSLHIFCSFIYKEPLATSKITKQYSTDFFCKIVNTII